MKATGEGDTTDIEHHERHYEPIESYTPPMCGCDEPLDSPACESAQSGSTDDQQPTSSSGERVPESRGRAPSVEDHIDEMDATREAMAPCYPPEEDEMASAARRRRGRTIEDHFDVDESERTVPVECED